MAINYCNHKEIMDDFTQTSCVSFINPVDAARFLAYATTQDYAKYRNAVLHCKRGIWVVELEKEAV